jgi:hypothetical protein
MHELELRGLRTGRLQPLPHVVLHRLDVMVDARLDGLHRGGIHGGSVGRESHHFLLHGGCDVLECRNLQMTREVLPPLRLDAHSQADQAGFTAKMA